MLPLRYHKLQMRHFLLALMIALLPLRAWVGDSMALAAWDVSSSGPVAQAVSAVHHSAGQATATVATKASEPPSHTAQQVFNSSGLSNAMAGMPDCHGPDNTANSGHNHKLCDLCNGPALGQVTLSIVGTVARDRLLVTRHERFMSAEPQPGQKPPIA